MQSFGNASLKKIILMWYYNTCDIVSVDMLKFAKKAEVPVRIIHSHNTENQIKMNMFHRITEKRNRKNIEKIATNLLACS